MKTLISIIIALSIISCHTSKENNNFLIIKSDINEADTLNFNQENYLNIFKDYYTLIDKEGRYLEGTYSKENQLITFYLYALKEEFSEKKVENNWVELTRIKDRKKLLLSPDDSYIYKESNLFDKEHNLFRVKPQTKENDKQIKKRLINNLDFILLYFDKINHSDVTSFSTYYLTSPIIYYSDGIGLENYENVSPVWKNYFYDEQDALKAHGFLVESLNSITSYPSSEKFTEGYYDAIKLMRDYLKH